MKASMSEGSLFLLCIKMASAPIKIAIRSCLLRYKENTHTYTKDLKRNSRINAPAFRYASARFKASSNPQPAMNASTRATMQKSGSVWVSLHAFLKKSY